ncbi:polyprenol phosphomannose-dependent alpha 1,6 mannosyltransferase MptB [Naumannella sp. ID2617S]|nr:polyprenol phosphomannose-dependent alpha 1,6 mannosyltransferase MptB [Naumannella sp. ID2617S]
MPARTRPWLLWACLGVLGSAMVAVLPFSVGYLPDWPRGPISRHLPWFRRTTGFYLARTSAVIGSVLLFAAWLKLRPRPHQGRSETPWRRIGLAWTVPMWPIPPVMTADAYAYAAQGWLLGHGKNPYEVGMGFPSPFADGIYQAWAHTTAVYPPLALQLQRFLVWASGSDPYWSVVAMRVMALAGVGLMVAVAPALARRAGIRPQAALWATALNPLVLVQFIGGAHNDALMVGLIMVALWLAGRRHGLILGSVAIGVAAAVKQPAILAGVGVVWCALFGDRPTERPHWGRALGGLGVGGFIGAAVFVLLSLPDRLMLGWMGPYAGAPSLVINHSPLSWIAQLLLRWKVDRDLVNTGLSVTSGILMLAGLAWVLWRFGPRRPVAMTAGSLLAFGLLGPAIQPWYVLWGGPLIPFTRPSARMVRVCLAVVLVLLISGVLQEFLPPPVVVPIGAAVALAWALWDRRRSRRAGAVEASEPAGTPA